jgi:hypothetical protein
MYYLEVISLILFVVLMIIGYKKNNRNIMLASSLCLLLGLAGPDFISGFKKGYSETVKVS